MSNCSKFADEYNRLLVNTILNLIVSRKDYRITLNQIFI